MIQFQTISHLLSSYAHTSTRSFNFFILGQETFLEASQDQLLGPEVNQQLRAAKDTLQP